MQNVTIENESQHVSSKMKMQSLMLIKDTKLKSGSQPDLGNDCKKRVLSLMLQR